MTVVKKKALEETRLSQGATFIPGCITSQTCALILNQNLASSAWRSGYTIVELVEKMVWFQPDVYSDYLQCNLCQLYNLLHVWMRMDMNIFLTSGLFLVFKEWRLYHSHLFCLLLLCTKTVCSLSLPFYCSWELLWASLGLNIFLLTCVSVCIVWNTCLPAVFPPSLYVKSRRTYTQSVWFQLSPLWHFTKRKRKISAQTWCI